VSKQKLSANSSWKPSILLSSSCLNENDDLFAGFTQEFDVSCLTIEKLHGQNSGDSLEKLPIELHGNLSV
jgi:hypothetical protein